MKRVTVVVIVVVVAFAVLLLGILGAGILNPPPAPTYTRAGAIPQAAVKMTPSTDAFPPVMLSTDWEAPAPVPGPVNTAGAEDSPFITPDGQTFLFFFTPDVQIPAEKQLLDHVSGIWTTRLVNGSWAEPTRVSLSADLALDGCPFLSGTSLWFCSARAANYRSIDLWRAEFRDGVWTEIRNAGAQLNEEYSAGEITLTQDGLTMYWGGNYGNASSKIYRSDWAGASGWGAPTEVPNVNNVSGATQPFVTPDGLSLWFTAPSVHGYTGPSVYRSWKQGDGWGTPEEVAANFAGEPTLDAAGNLYFVHHYFTPEMKMIEADIYVAHPKDMILAAVAGVAPLAAPLPSTASLFLPVVCPPVARAGLARDSSEPQ